MRAVLASLLVLGTSQLAAAQTIVDSPKADETYLTIYPDNLAMITETRKVNVPAGLSTIRFLGVSDRIISQTAVLQSFDGVSLESNFDSDLITKGALLNSSVGQSLKIRRINGATGDVTTETVKLISSANVNGQIQGAVFETRDGIETLDCAGLWEGLIFSGMPKELNPAPVLSMDVRADFAGEKEISISYLSEGISWQADYRLDVKGQKGEGPLTGWLTITNSTAKSFENVPTAVIAGKLNREGQTKSESTQQKLFTPSCWAKGSTKTGISLSESLYSFVRQGFAYGAVPEPSYYTAWDGSVVSDMAFAPPMPVALVPGSRREAKLEKFGDYKLYRMPVPINVNALQTKQIAFIDIADAEYDRVYKYDFQPFRLGRGATNIPQSMRVEYEVDNSRDGKIGKPLPRGTMRVMTERSNGKTAYLGEDKILDLAVDLPVEVAISESSAVMIVPSAETIDNDGALSVRLSADVLNATPDAIMAEVKLDTNELRYGNFTAENKPRKEDTIIPTYRFPVAPETRETVSVEFPIIQRGIFQHQPVKYLIADDSPNFYEEQFPVREFSIGSQAGNIPWLRKIIEMGGPIYVKCEAELLSKEIDINKDGVQVTILEERFKFQNESDQPAEIVFKFQSRNKLDLLDSSLVPDGDDRLEWTIKLPPNESKTLLVKTKGNHGI